MPDIRTLVSSEIHEPKHISDSDAADAGKVITPLGSGTSELRNLTPEEVGINYYYAELGVDANSTSTALTAAGDPGLYDPADYVLINSVRVPGGTVDEQNGITVDTVNYTMTVPVNGVYRTEGWFNVISDTNSTKTGIRFSLNGTPASSVLKADVKDLGRVDNISGTSLAQLSAGDVVGIAMACDKSANITITDFKATMTLLREL